MLVDSSAFRRQLVSPFTPSFVCLEGRADNQRRAHTHTLSKLSTHHTTPSSKAGYSSKMGMMPPRSQQQQQQQKKEEEDGRRKIFGFVRIDGQIDRWDFFVKRLKLIDVLHLFLLFHIPSNSITPIIIHYSTPEPPEALMWNSGQ